MKINILVIFVSFFLFNSCIREKELIGVYSIVGSSNTIDTLIIMKNGEYERSLYRKKDNSLIFKNVNTWTYGDGRITLKDYLPDADDDYSREVKSYKNVLITSSFPVERDFGSIIIYGRLGSDHYYYEKQ